MAETTKPLTAEEYGKICKNLSTRRDKAFSDMGKFLKENVFMDSGLKTKDYGKCYEYAKYNILEEYYGNEINKYTIKVYEEYAKALKETYLQKAVKLPKLKQYDAYDLYIYKNTWPLLEQVVKEVRNEMLAKYPPKENYKEYPVHLAVRKVKEPKPEPMSIFSVW